jgi:hypothetical protein
VSTSSKIQAVGLDVGTSRIVAARAADGGTRFAAQLNAFVDLPWSKLTATALEREEVPHTVDGKRIVVLGSESARFADMLGIEVRRPMARGVLDANESEALTELRRLLEHVVGPAESKGQRLCFSVPAGEDTEDAVSFHEASLTEILTGLGYSVRCIPEGLAVVYAELETTNYTGVGVSFGAGLCNVCLAYLSVPIASFSIGKAGDYIDANAASATGDLINRIRMRKEDAFHFNGHFAEKDLQALSVYYNDVVGSAVAEMRVRLADCARTGRFKRPVPVVLSGGSSLPEGFRSRFEQALTSSAFPVPVSEVRMAESPLETTAKGALVAALTED